MNQTTKEKRSLLLAFLAIALCAGGAFLLTRSEGPGRPSPGATDATRNGTKPAAAPPGASRTPPPPALADPLAEEIRKAEKELETASEQTTKARAEGIRLVEENRRLKRDLLGKPGVLHAEGEGTADDEEPEYPKLMAALRRRPEARDMADLLDIDPDRRRILQETWNRLTTRIQDAAKRHALGTETDAGITVTVDPFPEERKAIDEEWERFLAALLTPGERKRYDQWDLGSGLFSKDAGYRQIVKDYPKGRSDRDWVRRAWDGIRWQ